MGPNDVVIMLADMGPKPDLGKVSAMLTAAREERADALGQAQDAWEDRDKSRLDKAERAWESWGAIVKRLERILHIPQNREGRFE